MAEMQKTRNRVPGLQSAKALAKPLAMAAVAAFFMWHFDGSANGVKGMGGQDSLKGVPKKIEKIAEGGESATPAREPAAVPESTASKKKIIQIDYDALLNNPDKKHLDSLNELEIKEIEKQIIKRGRLRY